MGILNQHNMVDVQERAVEHGLLDKDEVVAAAPAVAAAVPAKPLTSDVSKDQVLRLAEEQLEVGKKLVEQGTTRIRRFVTEKPVEASVTLHEEHAEVVRRAITDPSYVQDIDWSDEGLEGVYRFLNVLPATYHIEAEATGFKVTVRPNAVAVTVAVCVIGTWSVESTAV